MLFFRWERHDFTGHNSPLYARPDELDSSSPGYQMNTNFSMNYWLSLGAKKEQLVMGVCGYGRGFRIVNPNNNGIYAAASGPIGKSSFSPTDGFWGYNDLCEIFVSDGNDWIVHRVVTFTISRTTKTFE